MKWGVSARPFGTGLYLACRSTEPARAVSAHSSNDPIAQLIYIVSVRHEESVGTAVSEELVRYVIPVATAIIGALGVVIANIVSTNRKIKEIETAYRHKLQDNYLENARAVTADVYLPLSISLNMLARAYNEFRPFIDFDRGHAEQKNVEGFESALRQFLSEYDSLMSRGADVYLTNELSEILEEMTSFLRNSDGAGRSVKKVVLDQQINIMGFGIAQSRREAVNFGSGARNFKWSMNVGGISLGYKESVLAAPVYTREFEAKFQTFQTAARSLIKEVTLGARHAS